MPPAQLSYHPVPLPWTLPLKETFRMVDQSALPTMPPTAFSPDTEAPFRETFSMSA